MTKRKVPPGSRHSLDREFQAHDNAGPTIGQELGHLSDGYYDADDTVSEISDGVFQTAYLATYPHCDELVECCGEAIDELADLPCNPKTRAAVMGRAMGLLRKKYHVDAPRGWYPVMKRLRDAASKSTTATGHPVGTKGAEGASRYRHEPARPPTEEEREAMQTATKMLNEAIIRWEKMQVKQGASLQDECERTKKELSPVGMKALNYAHHAKRQGLEGGDPAPEWAIRFRANFLKSRDRLFELFHLHGVD